LMFSGGRPRLADSPRHVPLRSCIACRMSAEAHNLLRIQKNVACGSESVLSFGSRARRLGQQIGGRSGYVHLTESCLVRFARRKDGKDGKNEVALQAIATFLESQLASAQPSNRRLRFQEGLRAAHAAILRSSSVSHPKRSPASLPNVSHSVSHSVQHCAEPIASEHKKAVIR
jgi:predicted RNA-binding protein YlxR (DUF448 family)